MLFNGRALIFTFFRTQVRIAEHERLQSLFKMSKDVGYVLKRGQNGFAVSRVNCCCGVDNLRKCHSIVDRRSHG